MINLTESKRICESRTSGLTDDMTEYFNHSVQEYPEALRLLEEGKCIIAKLLELDGNQLEFEVDRQAVEWLKEVE
jgi:hypothetical protein